MKPRKKKDTNNILKEKPIAKSGEPIVVIDYYRNLYTSMNNPVTNAFMDRLGKDWVKYTKDNLAVMHPSEFMEEKKIPYRTVERWVDKYEHFAEYYYQVKQIIGLRREERMLSANPSLYMNAIPDYLGEYKRVHEWRQATKAKNESENKQPITVVLPDYGKKND